MINIILWIIFGGIIGWIASMIMGTNEQQGVIANIVLGIIGAMVGGFIMRTLGASGVEGFNFYSFLVALLGAVIVIYLWKLIRRKA